MRKTLLIAIHLVLVCSAMSQDEDERWPRPKASDYPTVASTSATCSGFAPSKWTQMALATGDLNGDGRADCAAVFAGTDSRFLHKNDGFGSETFDTNPRILVIAFADNGGFRLVEQNNTFIISAESPVMTEPFQEVTIEKGILRFLFEEFYSAGSWGMANRKYAFRYQNGEMTLIGVDKTETRRNTGDLEIRSYNLSTGQMTIETGHISDDGKGKVRRRAFRVRPLPTLKTVKPMLTWEIEKDVII